MGEKVLLISVDGMRPDSLEAAGHSFVKEMMKKGSYTLHAQTVMPSVTLPCHMSMFHSVPPERHGIVDNVYTPQVRPVAGLCEQLRSHEKVCAFFYNWSELRDLTRPGSLAYSSYISGDISYEASNKKITEQAIDYMNQDAPDFTFLYLGHVDEAGHKYGWMSAEYIQAVHDSWACIEQAACAIPEQYTVIVTSDHGGHGRGHGTDMPEDMTIPLLMTGPTIASGKQIDTASILDIAPTVAKLLGVPGNKDWEGNCLV
ncbi:alkaline phosphatase family protein [Paenibacillus sp. J5C_2022]|uniref:alkaline phosphatase family protein n=1 Tax=Paenibacillus sp. J5C2022 TaxID=2977129 RepID=UPI0021CF3070|nr:alkaline phosphatase family protein [Paenibacillus sp. J5C2022]MCU6711389.1 alkaline phosphatase family protein [Paenibacillus sp. J5C2022]